MKCLFIFTIKLFRRITCCVVKLFMRNWLSFDDEQQAMPLWMQKSLECMLKYVQIFFLKKKQVFKIFIFYYFLILKIKLVDQFIKMDSKSNLSSLHFCLFIGKHFVFSFEFQFMFFFFFFQIIIIIIIINKKTINII